jgi:hypothetical protein
VWATAAFCYIFPDSFLQRCETKLKKRPEAKKKQSAVFWGVTRRKPGIKVKKKQTTVTAP